MKENQALRAIAAHPENGYFEKSHVRWFTLEDLKRERGVFREYFRNFLDMIQYRAPEIRRLVDKRSNRKRSNRKRSTRKRSTRKRSNRKRSTRKRSNRKRSNRKRSNRKRSNRKRSTIE